LTAIAVQRDAEPPRKAKPATRRRVDGDEGRADLVPQTWADVIIGAIPTEILALYTAVIGVVVGTIDKGKDDLLLFRWIAYAVTLVLVVVWLIAAYRRQRTSTKRRYPLAETAAAVVAFGAWGLVMPGSPLAASLDDPQWTTIWTIVITALGVAFLGMLGMPLKDEVKKKST